MWSCSFRLFVAAVLANGSFAADGPCDIYAHGGTPCVAAHSMTRALFKDYAGPLYSVMKMPEKITKDIFVTSTGGVADASGQESFCGSSECIVQRIYDQSPMQNHLGIEHGAPDLSPPRNFQDVGVNFSDPRSKAMLRGHAVYSAFFVGAPAEDQNFTGAGYSNRTARGTARGDEPESMYAVYSGRHYNNFCCFDYGNAENVTKDGKSGRMNDGAMEAVYWGSAGAGAKGPWIGADIENGIAATGKYVSPRDFVVGFVKGNSGNHFSVKDGDAQKSGSIRTVYDGPRPQGYEVMKKEGGIVLGIGGDNSPWAAGTFYEGVMTAGYASDETEAAVMGNIVSAGYGQPSQSKSLIV